MKWLFWLSMLLVAFSYAGYPLWLFLRSRWHSRPIGSAPILPSVSIVVAVHNEAGSLPAKLHNLSGLDYPADRYEVVIASDGSTDATNEILSAGVNERLRALFFPEHSGKAAVLNRAVQAARGEIICFTDARQILDPDALRNLVANFADPEIGCVSGELMLGEPATAEAKQGVGLYWRMEKKIRQWESASGSVVGATGAIYAVRHDLVAPLPESTILDDVLIPLQVARRGARVVFESRARAWDPLVTSPKQEFHRKVRTLTGNYQLLQIAPWVLSRDNPLRFEFVCHKLLRLLVPFWLVGILISSAYLDTIFYRIAFAFQLALYGLGLAAFVWPRLEHCSRLVAAAHAVVVLNSAAVLAFWNYVTRKKEVWIRPAPKSIRRVLIEDEKVKT